MNRPFSVMVLSAILIINISCSLLSNVEGVKNQKSTFRVLWSKNLDPQYQTGNLPIGLGNPFMYDGILFMGSADGDFNAYDFENGKVLWSIREEGSSFGSPATMYKKQLLYGSYEGRLYSRNYVSGKLKYAIDLGAPIESAMTIYRDRIYLHLRNHKLMCLDAETGKILWAYKRSIPFDTTLQRNAEPVPYKNNILVGFADGYFVAFSAEDGSIIWEQKLATGSKFIDVDAEPLLVRNKLFVGVSAGPMRVIDPDHGSIVSSIPLTVSRVPCLYKRGVIAGSIDGQLALLSPTGEIVQTSQIDKGGITSIVEWKDNLAVSTTTGKIYLVDPTSLKIKETFDLGSYASTIFGKLQVYNDRLVAYSSRNRLYVFGEGF